MPEKKKYLFEMHAFAPVRGYVEVDGYTAAEAAEKAKALIVDGQYRPDWAVDYDGDAVRGVEAVSHQVQWRASRKR